MGRRRDIEDRLRAALRVHSQNRLLVLFDEASGDVSLESGIILLGEHVKKDMLISATVLDSGSEIHGITPGDRVLVKRIMGTPIYLDDLGSCKLRLMDLGQVEALLGERESSDGYDYFRDGLSLSGDGVAHE